MLFIAPPDDDGSSSWWSDFWDLTDQERQQLDPSGSGCFGNGNILEDALHAGCENQQPALDWLKDSIFWPYVQDAAHGLSDTVKSLATFWIKIPSPALGNIEDGSKSDPVAFLQSALLPTVAVIMCFTILAGILAVIWTQRAEPAKVIAQMLLTYLFIDAIGVGAIAVALQFTDETSAWLIEKSTDGTAFTDNMFSLFDTTEGITSALLLLALLFCATVIAGFTCVLMIARGGILVALTGAMMIGVAMSGTKGGLQVMRHYFAWIAAFVFYKLAAAIVYAAGFRLLGTDTSADGNGLLQILQGITLLAMAVLALPAIIRIVVPMVAPAAQGRGAGGAAAGAAGALGGTKFLR